jgi:hypothetical protein
MKIGEAHRNVRSATLIQFFLLNKLISSIIGAPNVFGVSLVMEQGPRCANTIGAGWIGAPIYWRTDVPLRQ